MDICPSVALKLRKGRFSRGLLVWPVGYSNSVMATYENTASPIPKVLSAQPIGATVFEIRGWANSQPTKYHSLGAGYGVCVKAPEGI